MTSDRELRWLSLRPPGEEMELAKFLTEVYWAQDRGASVGSLCFLLGTFVFFRHQQDETKVIGHVGFTEKYCGLVHAIQRIRLASDTIPLSQRRIINRQEIK